METSLTPEQLEIAAEVHRVSVEEMAEFMRPADAPGRLFPPSVIRDMQQSIRDDVQRREWWEKLAGGGRVHGKLGTWDVRPPEPVGVTVQGEPWHYEAPKVIRDISEQRHRNLERLSVEGLRAPFAILDEALQGPRIVVPMQSNSAMGPDGEVVESVSYGPPVPAGSWMTASFELREARDLAEHDRVAELQKIAPNRAERRRLAREERRRG